ncbi:hypothetical protein ACFQL3_16980 [Natronoarchaeum sp. GCM10025321]|uniref:DUF7857 domain-containing protein n=1 Tax=Natronoarchaeum sp. GCM10025321 TaxID=3252684 RepID=UPI0036116039
MPTISWTQRRENGVTLVEAVIQSTTPTGPTTVALESRLSGPVWPPRSEGVPVAGWDGPRYETTVEGESRVAVGFASPAEPCEPPVELVESAPATAIEESTDADAADVLRALGDPTPPRGAVPTSLPEESLPTATVEAEHTDDDQ